RPDLRGDSFCSYSQIVDYAVAKKASAVIAAGDFLDIRLPGSRVIGFVREKLELLQKANCQQYFILGQHDYADPPWPSAVSDNAIHMDRKLVALEGMQFYGLDWRRAEELTDALNGIPKEARILIAHQVWSEFMGVGRSEGSWEQIPRHIHTLFTGDF